MKLLLSIFLISFLTLCLVSCSSDNKNPAKHLMTKKQKDSLNSLTNMNDGLLYTMNYTADYKLDDVLNSSVSDVDSLTAFINNSLLDGNAKGSNAIDAGCSAFTVTSPDGHVLYGRNFDYKMDMTAVIIKTTPENGYASIGLVDAGWIGYGINSLSDGKTDLSMAVGFPYLIMDGMNEKGVAISVLKLDGDGTSQDTGKNKIMTTVALRLVLDRADNVEKAVELLQNYDMQSAMKNANFHFLLSDATGKTVVIEYCNNKISVLTAHYITNYYIDPSMHQFGHGKDRYETIESTLLSKKDILTSPEAMSLLKSVSQAETEEATSMTQWSVVYDLTERKASVAIRRDYNKLFHFSINDIKGID